MQGEIAGVGAPRAFERGGDREVTGPALIVGERTRGVLANAIMVGLDRVPLAGPPGSYEPLGTKRGDDGPRVVREAGGLLDDPLLEGASRDGDHLEGPPRPLGEAGESRGDDLGERDLHGAAGRDVPHELADEERVSIGLARDGRDDLVGRWGIGRREEPAREVARALERERSDVQIPNPIAQIGVG